MRALEAACVVKLVDIESILLYIGRRRPCDSSSDDGQADSPLGDVQAISIYTDDAGHGPGPIHLPCALSTRDDLR